MCVEEAQVCQCHHGMCVEQLLWPWLDVNDYPWSTVAIAVVCACCISCFWTWYSPCSFCTFSRKEESGEKFCWPRQVEMQREFSILCRLEANQMLYFFTCCLTICYWFRMAILICSLSMSCFRFMLICLFQLCHLFHENLRMSYPVVAANLDCIYRCGFRLFRELFQWNKFCHSLASQV